MLQSMQNSLNQRTNMWHTDSGRFGGCLGEGNSVLQLVGGGWLCSEWVRVVKTSPMILMSSSVRYCLKTRNSKVSVIQFLTNICV